MPQVKACTVPRCPTRHVCADPAYDMLLAYAHNGQALAPDHGYPVRLLAPGNIGGRSVKWLCDITVGDQVGGSGCRPGRPVPAPPSTFPQMNHTDYMIGPE